MRKWLCLGLIFAASAASAFEPGDIERAEVVLSRLTLERGAFVTCAAGNRDLAGHLTDSWAGELKAAAELLQQHGFPSDLVSNLSTRFDITAASPSFATDQQRERFCAVLGDWQRRWELFYIQPPEMELKKVLEQ